MRPPRPAEGRRHAEEEPGPPTEAGPAAPRPRPVPAPPPREEVPAPGDAPDDPRAAHAAITGPGATGVPLAAQHRAPVAPPPQPDPPRRGLFRRAARPAEAAAARLRALAGPAPGAEPDPDAPAPRRAALPAPLRPLLEGFAGLVLLLALDLALGARGFEGWPVHPFALPVLWVAARHGALPAVAVALAAGIARLGLAPGASGIAAEAWAEPLAWLAAALLVGLPAKAARRRREAAEARAEEAIATRAALAESNERLAVRAMELDARLGARLAATGAVFEAARALGEGTGGVIRGATGLVRAATGCAACSFWLAEGGALRLVAAEGWPEEVGLARRFVQGPLMEALETSAGALLVTRHADRAALGEEGVLAAPVRSPSDGALLGMVKVEDIGFPDLAPDTVAALEAAAFWLGTALAEAHGREARGEAGPVGGPVGGVAGGVAGGVVAGEDAPRAVATMLGLARRLGFDLVLLSAGIPGGPRAAAALEATRAAMAEAFGGADLLMEVRQHDRRLSVLLPGTDLPGAEAAAARLRGLLAARAPAAEVVVGVARLHAAHG
jgi:hypothetical protein